MWRARDPESPLVRDACPRGRGNARSEVDLSQRLSDPRGFRVGGGLGTCKMRTREFFMALLSRLRTGQNTAHYGRLIFSMTGM